MIGIPTRALWSLFAALMLWGALYPSTLSASPKRQVILILLDAARWDRFMYAGYERPTTPRMHELGEKGITSDNHFADWTQTRQSLPSMLYSRYFAIPLSPLNSQIPIANPGLLMRKIDDEAISLPKALQAAGFKTAAVSAHSWIRPETPFAKAFEELILPLDKKNKYSSRTDLAIDRATDWIKDHSDEDYFLYIHLMETHFPHKFDSDAKIFFDGADVSGSPQEIASKLYPKNTSQAWKGESRRVLDAAYDGSLYRADREIGRLIDFLREEGLFNDTFIVITSDHGEHLLETANRFEHGGPWFDAVARIPLIISYPGHVTPGKLKSFSGLVDIAPTIMGVLEIDWPEGKSPDGKNLIDESEKKSAAEPFAISAIGLRTHSYKLLIYAPDQVLAPPIAPSPSDVHGALFDLSQDPSELDNLWSERADVVTKLIGKYRDTLSHAFTRFMTSKNHQQPSDPFAIASNYFESDVLLTQVDPSLGQKSFLAVNTKNGWLQSSHWEKHWLLATKGAVPLQVSFSVPNGRYQISVKIAGKARIMLPGRDALEVRGPEILSIYGTKEEMVNIGVSRVSDEVFYLRIFPDSESDFKINLIGFDPIPAGAAETKPTDEELVEQLRSLGYLE